MEPGHWTLPGEPGSLHRKDMQRYRSAWRMAVAITTALSVVSGALTIGWLAVVGAPLLMSVMGALFGLCWVGDERRRRRIAVDCALWSAVAGELMIGLPPLMGPWSLLILIVLGGLCPPLVEIGIRQWQGWMPVRPAGEPHRLSDRDLERRWRRTTQDLHGRAVTPATVLQLVQERSTLLDELERRDPERFAAMLVRSGWREPQDL